MCYWAGMGPGEIVEVPDDRPIYAYKLLQVVGRPGYPPELDLSYPTYGGLPGQLVSPWAKTIWPARGLHLIKPLDPIDYLTHSRGIYCYKTKPRIEDLSYTRRAIVKVRLTGQVIVHAPGRRCGRYVRAGYRAMHAVPETAWVPERLLPLVQKRYPELTVEPL